MIEGMTTHVPGGKHTFLLVVRIPPAVDEVGLRPLQCLMIMNELTDPQMPRSQDGDLWMLVLDISLTRQLVE